MASECVIHIELMWNKIPTDLGHCSGCEDQIFSDMWVLFLLFSGGRISKSDTRLCECCYDCIDKD